MIAEIAPEERCVNVGDRLEWAENAGPEKEKKKVFNIHKSSLLHQRSSTFNFKRSENVDRNVMV